MKTKRTNKLGDLQYLKHQALHQYGVPIRILGDHRKSFTSLI